MADWDASGSETENIKAASPAPIKPPAKKKWADEDEEEKEVASDWEASESEEEKPKVAKPVVVPPNKKGSLKKKLAEKAAAREAQLANGEDSPDTEDDLIDPQVKKRLERERELAADMKNAADLLGHGQRPTSSSKELDVLLMANPKTKEEFAELSGRIVDTIYRRLENKPLYATFLEQHMRELARPLRDVDIRKTASSLTALANEKQKEVKEAGKKKKSAKPALATTKPGKADTRIYDESFDDFGNDPDDFM